MKMEVLEQSKSLISSVGWSERAAERISWCLLKRGERKIRLQVKTTSESSKD